MIVGQLSLEHFLDGNMFATYTDFLMQSSFCYHKLLCIAVRVLDSQLHTISHASAWYLLCHVHNSAVMLYTGSVCASSFMTV